MESLKDIFLSHEGKISDKWQLYIETWDELFEEFREKSVNILEIGIQNGGSLEVWAKYFKNAAYIVGCDIEEKCGSLDFEDPRIRVIVGDVLNVETLKEIKQISPEYSIIIDDGSHKSSDIIRTFGGYFPLLEFGGIYIVEDLHASYWSLFEGGLYEPFSSKAFFCRLVDLLNFEHWHGRTNRLAYLEPFLSHYCFVIHEQDLGTLHSIKFLNSLCIIRKESTEKNQLGLRFVKGSLESITEGSQQIDHTRIQDTTKTLADDSRDDCYGLLDRLTGLSEEKKHLQRRNRRLLERLSTERNANLIALQNYQNKMDQEKKIINAKANLEIERLKQILLIEKIQLEEIKKFLHQAERELAESRAEVIEYVNSRSWKLTRPFRKILMLLRGRK